MSTTIKPTFRAKADLRLAMAIYCLDILDKLASEGQIPGIRKNEAIQLLEKISSCVSKMREWTKPKKFLLVSNYFRGYNNLLSTFISRLGVNWFRVAKKKNDYTAKLLRFAIFNLRSLGSRLKKCPDDSPASAVKIRYVRVLELRPHPRDKNLHIAKVTDMEMIYEVVVDEPLEEKSVVIFAHLPPKKVKGFVSEGMVLKDEEGNYITADEELIGQRPSEIPKNAEEEIGKIVTTLLEEEFLI
ncbi:MAG: hypothetical protein ACP6IP_08990 [Candidatus Njordarchaeia archaeon]